MRRPGALQICLLLALPGVVAAQSDIATGTLVGSVFARAGDPLGGVAVSATHLETGFARHQRTDDEGRFQIRLLPPGNYVVRTEHDGYAPFEQREIRLQVGDEIVLRIELQLLAVADQLVVVSEAPLVEATRTSLTSTVDRRAIETLPLNGRDFKDLVLLSPQVVQTTRETFSGGGHEHSMSSFNIDGADANSFFFAGPRGGLTAPFTYSQAAIQEFQVVRSSYNARFGGAAGVIVNAVTRTGTNALHGGAHFFFQDDGMVATDALGNESDAFERQQAGLHLGGPIRRDAVHFFFAYDGQRRDDDFPRRPTGLEPELEPLFEARLESLGLDPAAEYDYVTTNDNDVLTLRLDWAPNERHRLWLRDNWSDQRGENAAWGGFTAVGQSANGSEETSFNSVVLALASVLGSWTFNEASLQYSFEERPRGANTTELPWAIVGAFNTLIGRPSFLPNALDEDRLQLQDNLTLQRGAHTLRAGLDYGYLELRNTFCFFCGGQYFFPTYDAFISGVPLVYSQGFSPVDGVVEFKGHLVSLYAGDKWQAGPRLTLEYGLRLQHQANPSPETAHPLEPRTGFIPDDTDLAPRFGFAWDVRGDGRSVLRGGAGGFHNWTPSLLPANVLLNNGVNLRIVQLFSGHPLLPRYPDRLPPEVGALPELPPDINLFAPDFENPETYRFSLGYEHTLGSDFSVGAEVAYSESRHRERIQDVNLDPTPIGLTPDGRPVYGGPPARIDPAFGRKTQFTSDAEADYLGLTLAARKRFSQRWALELHYTYAEARDHDSVEFDVVEVGPEDHYDLDQDWGPSAHDIRHRAILAGSYSAPWGLTLSFFGRYRSAPPLNPLAGGEDLNNDGFFQDRPGPDPSLGLDRHLGRNSFRGEDWWHLDLRAAKAFTFAGDQELELLLEVFNITNADILVGFDTDFTRGGELNEAFGQPLQAFMPRAFQVGLRYRF